MQEQRSLARMSLAFLALAMPAAARLQESESASAEAAQEAAAEPAPASEAQPPPPPGRSHVEGLLPWAWSQQLTWRSIGPANMGGRITDVAAHPSDSSTFWVGTAGGGLLKTVNAGVTYEHQFDDQNSCSIGAVTVAPSNPDVVWVGTGENNPRNSVSWGDGVYKSTDGGATWKHMGLAKSFQISRILVHPEDENLVYVAALGRLWGPSEERGLFRSRDGGETWERILYVDDRTGVIDLRMKPDDPRTLLAATYERERDIHDSNDPAKKWGPGSGLHRSTDGGDTWTAVTSGLPTVSKGRIGLDWYAKDASVVYAIVESERITQEPENAAYLGLRTEDAEVGARVVEVTEKSPAAEAGVQKSDLVLRLGEVTILGSEQLLDELKKEIAGNQVELELVRERKSVIVSVTLGKRPPPEGDPTDELGFPRPGPYSIGLGGQRENVQDEQGEAGHEFGGVYRSEDAGATWTRINSLNPRPMYYSEIRVDPSDASFVYVLGTSLYRSSDGGKTFTADGHDDSVHVDHHALWIDPRDGRHMVLGNDGGLYVTWDRMAHWDHHNHVAIGQFYDVGIDRRRDYRVFGGLQDNGSWGGPSVTRTGSGPTNADWIRVGGGDGFVCEVDANDHDLVYYESQGGGMGRRHLSTNEGGFIRPRGEQDIEYRFNWRTPFLLSHHNSRIHYSAGNYVFRSLDRGNSARRISPELTISERGSATALAESPSNPDVLFAGTDDGALWTTRDGGHTWIDLFALNAGLENGVEAAPRAEATPRALTVARRSTAPAESPAGDDPLSGTWTCKARGAGIDDETEGRFTLELELDADGTVRGKLASDIGNGPIEAGKWDPEKRSLAFRFPGETLVLSFTAELGKDGQLDGEIVAAGGSFSFDFKGERSGAAAAAGEAGPPPAKEQQQAVESEAEATPPPAEEPAKPRKFLKNTIDQLLPGRRYVSAIVPSAHKRERVFVAFDGHRSNDDAPYVFVSEDGGDTWKSLAGGLPESVGSVRALAEDTENDDLLFLGTEFRAFVSVDRGKTWTELGGNLPTVAVHDFAISDAARELVAGTHGRSVWVLDIAALRGMTEKAIEADAALYPVNRAVRWRNDPERGGTTRQFVGQNPPRDVSIFYSLRKKARQVKLEVRDAAGAVLRELEASAEQGLHRVAWDGRRGTTEETEQGERRFRRGRSLPVGSYRVVLTVDGATFETPVEVLGDPSYPDDPWAEETTQDE